MFRLTALHIATGSSSIVTRRLRPTPSFNKLRAVVPATGGDSIRAGLELPYRFCGSRSRGERVEQRLVGGGAT
jgi:hypothetical protein